MNNEEFLKCRKIYDRLFNEKRDIEEKRNDRLLEIETRMSMLEEDEKVKEYIELTNAKLNIDNDKFFSRINGKTPAQIAFQAFDYTCKRTKDSNNIYVFMGCDRDNDTKADRKIYRNLETLENVKINIKAVSQFEKENKVIFSSVDNKEYFFSLLRANFLQYLINNSQEESLKKILKLGKRLFNSNN